MLHAPTRPLSELELVNWPSFELPTEVMRDVRIDCADIPELLRRTASGEIYNSIMGPELSASLLDYYEYTMHLQFCPVMNEVLPFLLGIMQTTEDTQVIGNVLRFLAWAFTAAYQATSSEKMTDAFELEEAKEMSASEKEEFLHKVSQAGSDFFALLPEIVLLVRPFLSSPELFVRGAASRFLLVAGALRQESSEELLPILRGQSGADTLLNWLELYDYSLHLLLDQPQEEVLDHLKERLLIQEPEQALLWDIWRVETAYRPSDTEQVRQLMEAVMQQPNSILPNLNAAYGAAMRFQGYDHYNVFPWGDEVIADTDDAMRENVRRISQRVLERL